LAEVATTELKPVYLITGGDRPKIHRALRRLRDRIGEEGVELLSANDAGGDDAVAACNSMGLLGGGRRLVIVEEVERWKAADTKAIAAYLGSPAPDTVLALVAAELKKDSALAKACAKAGDLLVYDVPKRRIAEWVTKQFSDRRVTIDQEAVRLLVEVVGEDPVGVFEVEQLAAGCAEVPGYELTDAWGRRDLAAALTSCQTLIERSGDSVSRTVPSLIGLLVAHVGRVRDCQLLAEEGLSAREAATRLKRHPFYVEKLFAQSRNYDSDELRGAVVRLAELDHAVKGGSRLAVDLELERALIDITRPREAAIAS
jgi:DNA polymerase-3 subunit delta